MKWKKNWKKNGIKRDTSVVCPAKNQNWEESTSAPFWIDEMILLDFWISQWITFCLELGQSLPFSCHSSSHSSKHFSSKKDPSKPLSCFSLMKYHLSESILTWLTDYFRYSLRHELPSLSFKHYFQVSSCSFTYLLSALILYSLLFLSFSFEKNSYSYLSVPFHLWLTFKVILYVKF